MLKRIRAFDLRDNEWNASDLGRGCAHHFEIFRAFDKGLTDRINARAERELEAFTIPLRKCADAEVDARQVQSLARTQLAANGDCAMHVIACDAVDHQLHQSVIQKEAVA